MGWQPDLPDPRDYTYRHKKIQALLYRLPPAGELPDEVDLRSDCEVEHFTEPKDQGPLNASSAFAVLSLVAYFERRVNGRAFDGSELFLYRVTRNYLSNHGSVAADVGADLRTTLKTLVRVGVPPEHRWPYGAERFCQEPDAFHYSLARTLPGLYYFRLDTPDNHGQATLDTLLSFLAAGFPVAFGFSVPSSLTNGATIPYRPDLDGIRGGQAVVAVGYRRNRRGAGQDAILIRNSWGNQWGENGYGWLPFTYVGNQFARDFWGILGDGWLESRELACPTTDFR